MTIQQVFSLIGEGEEIASSSFSDTEIVSYQWMNSDGGNIIAMFENGKLTSKAQAGLK